MGVVAVTLLFFGQALSSGGGGGGGVLGESTLFLWQAGDGIFIAALLPKRGRAVSLFLYLLLSTFSRVGINSECFWSVASGWVDVDGQMVV